MYVHDTAQELFNELLETYFDEYYYLSDAKTKTMDRKYKPKKLFLEGYNYNDQYKYKELTDKGESIDLSDMVPLEGDDEEVKKGK